MLTSDFDYNLPPELIAQVPVEPRDASRLMVVDRQRREWKHEIFSSITKYLQAGDLLVWNSSKVFKARLRGSLLLDEKSAGFKPRSESTDRILNSAPVEIFLLRPTENAGVWRVLAKPGRRLRLGLKIVFAEDFYCEVMLKETDGTFLVQFPDDDLSVRAKANKYGEVPTPPYIKMDSKTAESACWGERYQTVYAKHEGSVAAPTAGFHFTPALIEQLKNKGVEFAEITLHVGLGTFQPVKSELVEKHKMHNEWVEIDAHNTDLINQAKADGRRIVAVGTTTVRALEGVAQCAIGHLAMTQCATAIVGQSKKSGVGDDPLLRPYTGDVNLFITPGFKFRVVDALITNFHLPKSTLLMLVSSFIGDRQFLLKCYEEAIEKKYRFYSFGDAMLIK